MRARTNRGLILIKRNPLHFPRGPIANRAIESEAYGLGCDARNDLKPIDENPFPYASRDNLNWDRGWANTDRALEAEEN